MERKQIKSSQMNKTIYADVNGMIIKISLYSHFWAKGNFIYIDYPNSESPDAIKFDSAQKANEAFATIKEVLKKENLLIKL